jgi:hypothetical protein
MCSSPVLIGLPFAVREFPGPGPGPPFRGSVEDLELVWWARDDRGNHYLAEREQKPGGRRAAAAR